MRTNIAGLALCLLVLSGCGIDSAASQQAFEPQATNAAPSPRDVAGNAENGTVEPSAAKESGNSDNRYKRRIIYRADLTLIVDDFTATESELPKLVKGVGGYVSETSIGRNRGVGRQATWVARVPVPNYEDFLKELTELGVAEGFHQKANDVTAQFVDLEARIANKKQLEARIVELLKQHSGKISELLEIELESAKRLNECKAS